MSEMLERRSPLRAGVVVLAMQLLLVVACRSTSSVKGAEGPSPHVAASREESASAVSDIAAEPNRTEPVIEELELAGAFPVLIWRPGRTGPHSLVVSAHGAGCRAEDHCAYLWRLTGGQAIVACLRGEPLFRNRPEQGFFYRDHFALGRELDAAMTVLRGRLGSELGESATFVGYSQGATMGALALPDSEAAFQQLVFIEGGGEGMSRRSAERLRDRGTARVLFACGTKGCAERARRTAGGLEAVGISARSVHAVGAGHTYLGAVEEQVASQTSWLWP